MTERELTERERGFREAELVARWIAAADEVALAFAHEPDAKVDAETRTDAAESQR